MKGSFSSSIMTVVVVFCFALTAQPAEGAATPRLTASSTLRFGAVMPGDASSRDLTIKNRGKADLTVSTAVVSDAEFTVATNTCTTVAPGSSCAMTITFTPAAYTANAKTATLTIPSNDPESPKTVTLKGSCPRPNITGLRDVLNFGSKKTGGSYAKKMTIGNRRKPLLAISSFEVSNDDEESHDFSLSDDTTCDDASLAKGETCEIWVYFKPSSPGEKSGSLTFSYNDQTGAIQTATVRLEGTGVGSPVDSPPAINSFSALPVAVTLGGSTTLSWNVTKATSLSINQGVGTVTGTSIAVTPTTKGKITYTLTAANSYGTSTATTTITVSSNTTDAIDPSPFAVSVAETAGTYDPADIEANTVFDHTVMIDFTANTARLSTGTAQEISADGVTLVTDGSNSLTVAKTTYGLTITSTLASAINYRLSGVLNGTLTVSNDSTCELYLNGATVNGASGPALNLTSSRKVFIVTAPGTVNTLTDQATRSGMTMKAALYGKGPLVFSGDGTLSVTGNYKHAIFSNDYIRVRGGTLQVAVTARDAIRSINGFIFDDGALTINATGTTIDEESKGIKVEGSDDATYNGVGKGYIVINGGYLTITSVGKAITAAWDIDEDPTTSVTTDDPSPYAEINNGIITIVTTGTPYEYVAGGTVVSCSPEGIEAKSDLVINSGYFNIRTTDDALNAGTSITINGGFIYAAASANDAIDSNGVLTITGGVTVAIGARVPESAFDCDQNTFAVTGGTFVGIAGATSMPTASASTQNSVILGSRPAGTTMALKASDGLVAFAFTVPQSYLTMLFSSPDIETGTTYTIYTGGTASADCAFNGLYLGGMSYSGGTAGTSFTVSKSVTDLSR